MRLTAIIVTISLNLFFSCGKEPRDLSGPAPPPPPPTLPPQPTLLSTIKSYKTNGPTDTILKVLEYDNLNRITKIREYKNGTEVNNSGTYEIKFSGNQIISLFSSFSWPATIIYDTIELDAYKMPSKRITHYTINEYSGGTTWKVYHFQTTLYQYRSTGEYDGEKTYIDDSVYFQSSSQFLVTKRLDTITNVATIENNNIKLLTKTSKNKQWQWNYGVLTFTSNTLVDETDYVYTKGYLNHPANDLNYLNFIYGFYHPYMYFNNRKNFQNIPDRFVYRNSGGTTQINYNVTYTDKGYVKTIQSDVPSDPKLEFMYK
jgi:hypothetical protein